MGFFRQEYWSGLPFPPPGNLPDPGIEPASLASPALAGRFFTTEPVGKPIKISKKRRGEIGESLERKQREREAKGWITHKLDWIPEKLEVKTGAFKEGGSAWSSGVREEAMP